MDQKLVDFLFLSTLVSYFYNQSFLSCYFMNSFVMLFNSIFTYQLTELVEIAYIQTFEIIEKLIWYDFDLLYWHNAFKSIISLNRLDLLVLIISWYFQVLGETRWWIYLINIIFLLYINISRWFAILQFHYFLKRVFL